MVAVGQVVPMQVPAQSATPIPAPPQIKLTPPMQVPEEIRAPRPQRLPTADRVTTSKQQTDGASQRFSWIFTPSTASSQSATSETAQSKPRWIRR
ncbi:MAG TPA: hypothetical protein VE890_07200 [Thermoguttaceae bacterium]|nr:hypothetical protein [Thermoguttaceae bacterium]